MKRYIHQLFFSIAVISLLAGCEKDENQVTYLGGTAPVLTASSTTPLVLTPANAGNFALKFNWSNPEYRFNTGVSSQDVTYYLQVDTTGANFTNPKMQQVSISKDLELSLTVKELNAILTKLDISENAVHSIDFRIKSTVGGTALPLYSNVIKMNITPYLDVAVPLPPTNELYLTGDALPSSWTNTPPLSQKMTPVASSLTSTGKYTSFIDTVALTPGKLYKFLSTQGAWQPQYGGKVALGGDLGYNMGSGTDPDAIPTPTDVGNYEITVNFKTGKYAVRKL